MLEQYRRLLWNNLGGVIVALDLAARVTYANQEALDMLGYTEQELLGRNWLEITALPEQRQQAQELFQRMVSGQMADPFLASSREIRTKSGRNVHMAWRSNPVVDDAGRIIGTVSCGQNMTEEKQARNRLDLHNKIAQIMELDRSFADSAGLFLAALAQQSGWVAAEILLARDPGGPLCQFAWWTDGREVQDFFAFTCEQLSFGKGEGLPGMVWANGAPTWIDDVSVCDWFLRREAAAAAGIRAAMGFPLWVGGEVVGVIVLYSEHTQLQNEDVVALYATIGIQIGGYYQRKKAEESLRRSERLLAMGAEIVHLGIWEWDIPSGQERWSDEQYRIFGHEPAGAVPTYELFLQAICDHDRPAVLAAVNKALTDPTYVYDVECRIVTADAKSKHIRCQGEVVRDGDGRPVRMIGTVLDISEIRRSEEQLKIWGELFNNSGEAMLITDPTPKILGVNREFTRLTGYEAAEVLGKNPNILKSDRHDRVFFQKFWASLAGTGYWQGEIWDRRKDGTEYPKWSTISRIKNEQGVTTHYVATFTDISERKAADAKINYLYHYDPLTGLPNRTLLYEQTAEVLAKAAGESRRVAVMSLDLDQFKIVNDSFGHSVGDMLIQQVARRLRACVRESDLVCRTGGDEFVIVLPHIKNIAETLPVAEKVAEQIRQPIVAADTEFALTTSIGISVYPEDGTERDLLLRNADIAMNFAKETGRNRYRFFTEDLSDLAANKMRLVNDLRKAVDRGEFVLYYQPQIAVATNRMIGAEALLRWEKPDVGIVAPGEFIAVAEESGLILPIGDWVLNEACRQCRQWEDLGLPPLLVAVNISAIQFQQPGFVAKVAVAMADSRAQSVLEIEITEGVVMDNSLAAAALLTQLKDLGCQLAIDDFGTGYSSLAYLTKFPVDRLKIDQSFVRTMLVESKNMAIVESIVSLAKNLKMRVIAEGVETQAEYQALRQRGCDEVQGYYFAKPMPPGEFLRWRREQGC